MIKSLWDNGSARITIIIVGAFVLCTIIFFAILYLPFGKVSYPIETMTPQQPLVAAAVVVPIEPVIPAHIPTPDSVRAVYYTSWAAGHPRFRKEMFDLVDTTEINAVVIDVKDYSGRISFVVHDPELVREGAAEKRIPDVKELIDSLHEKGVYVIARISSFQDSYLVSRHPEWAVKTKSGAIWQDRKGVKWLDAAATPVWDYLVRIGNEAYAQGFDELNFDYIRFPSDGNMKDIAYTWGEGKTRAQTMRSFFDYIHNAFASTSIVTSADLFGLVTSSNDDLGIGQVLEDALINFDYVAPMVYPSHFGKGYHGIEDPAAHPYDVIHASMSSAVTRATLATTSPFKLRPWLQAFNLGATYTPAMVRTQMQATYDVGLTSWMLWNAGAVYNKESLLPKGETLSSTSTPLQSGAQILLEVATTTYYQ